MDVLLIVPITRRNTGMTRRERQPLCGARSSIILFRRSHRTRDEKTVAAMAAAAADEIAAMKPEAVMCQGEFTLSFALINALKLREIPVMAACSERRTTETYQADGSMKKTSEFCFVRFRKY